MNDDDMDSLAAEYVLGTLDADERTRAQVLLDVDHGFRGKVRVWERRLGELHLMVEPVEPPPQVWERIKGKLGEGGPDSGVTLPEPVPEPGREPEPAAAAAPDVTLPETKSPDLVSAEQDSTAEVTPESRVEATVPASVTIDQMRPARRGRGWPVFAVLMTLVAVALVGLLAAWRFIPDRLPAALQAKTILKIPEASTGRVRRPLPPGSQFDE